MTGGGNRSQPQVVKTRVNFYVCLVCFTMNKSEQKMTHVTIFLLVSSDLFHYEQKKSLYFMLQKSVPLLATSFGLNILTWTNKRMDGFRTVNIETKNMQTKIWIYNDLQIAMINTNWICSMIHDVRLFGVLM